MHAAILAQGNSTFSREVVIKSQEKSRKDNGKQRQLWFAFGNTIGQLWPQNFDQECPLSCPCYNGQASAHSLNFTCFYDSITSDIRSLKTLDLYTTRYGYSRVCILHEKLPEKLLKEYPCANPALEQLIDMVHGLT